jgi:hypothetical protein
MDHLFSTVLKHIKQKTVTQSMMYENETATKIDGRLLAFYCEDTVDISTVCCWVIKSKGSARNFDLNDQPRSESPVTETHNLNKQICDKLIQENQTK